MTASLVAGGIGVLSAFVTSYWLDRRGHRVDLETTFRQSQREQLLELTGRYHGGLVENATTWNYRMLNLFANTNYGWLRVDAAYDDPTKYYFVSAVYRFLALLSLAQGFEMHERFIDARYVEAREIEFVKFTKAFHWVMSDVALFKDLDYDVGTARDHFMSDNLRAVCDAFLDGGAAPSFRMFRSRVSEGQATEFAPVFAFFDGLTRAEPRYRWDRLVCLHLLTTAFVAEHGYEWQRPGPGFISRAVRELQHPEVLRNFVEWLPKLGLEDQACLAELHESTSVHLQASPPEPPL